MQWGWPRVVQYLIGHGAKVDIKDDAGVSPLDASSGKGRADNRPSDGVAKMLQTARPVVRRWLEPGALASERGHMLVSSDTP